LDPGERSTLQRSEAFMTDIIRGVVLSAFDLRRLNAKGEG